MKANTALAVNDVTSCLCGGSCLIVDQTVTSSDGEVYSFEVDSFKKHCLLNGLDDIGLTMEKVGSIDNYELKLSSERPWV